MQRDTALAFVVPVSLLLTWEAVARFHVFPPLIFPSLGAIGAALLDSITGWNGSSEWFSGKWHVQAAASARRVFLGFALGSGLGIIAGIFTGMSRLAHQAFDPSVQLLRPIPIVAWIPLSLVWFGIEDASALFLIALGTFFPTCINTRHGVAYVDTSLIRAAKMLGYLTRWELFRRVVFFSALPSIFTGLRISIGIAWMSVVASEMLAIKSGFGYMLWDSYNFLRADLVIAAMVSIAVLGYASDRLVLRVRRAVLSWER